MMPVTDQNWVLVLTIKALMLRAIEAYLGLRTCLEVFIKAYVVERPRTP